VENASVWFNEMTCLKKLQRDRWFRALNLGKLLFEDEGYFISYLAEIEDFIRGKDNEECSLVFIIIILAESKEYDVTIGKIIKNFGETIRI